MTEYLPNGYKINNDHLGEYTIIKVLGRGASAIAYLVQYDNLNGLISKRVLKEYYPSYIALSRSKDGCLVCDEKALEKFENGKEQFKRSGQRQNKLRSIVSLTNQTPPIQEIFCINNTVYLDVMPFEGETFDNVNDFSLLARMRICLSIAKLVKRYHDSGYLCLDIKPSNVLVLDTTAESKDVINFVDFDSIRHKSNIVFGGSLSFTELWAAPEQNNPYGYNKISERTDIYTIGELVFWTVFGRHSTIDEHRSFSTYPFENTSSLFSKDMNRYAVQKTLTRLFRNTLRSSVRNRYSTMDEVISILEELIEELNKKEYIKTCSIRPKSFFIGREQELKAIETALQEHSTVFISGIAGIGKSEIIKQYLCSHRDEYDIVLYWTFEGDFENMICNENLVSIANFSRLQEENDTQYCERKLKRIKELLKNENNLVVIDNLDKLIEEIPQQKVWNLLQTLPCKILISTRNNETLYKTVLISEISEMEKLNNIFMEYCPYDKEQENYVEEIIKSIDNHTLLIELIANQTKAKHISPQKTLEDLQNWGINSLSQERVRLLKDGNISSASVFAHVEKLFSMDTMTERQIILMTKFAFIPITGLPLNVFCAFYSVDTLDDINWLINHGWLYLSKDSSEIISVHPVISDVVIDLVQTKPDIIDEFYRAAITSIKVRNVIKLKQEEHIVLSDQIALLTYRHHVETKTAAIFLIRYTGMFLRYGNIEAKEKIILYAIQIYSSFICENSYSAVLEEAYINYVTILWEQNLHEDAIQICETHMQKSKAANDIYFLGRWYMLLSNLYNTRDYYDFKHIQYYWMAIHYAWKLAHDSERKHPIYINENKLEQLDYNYISESKNRFSSNLLIGFANLLENSGAAILFCSKSDRNEISQLKHALQLRKHIKSDRILCHTDNSKEIIIDEARIHFLSLNYSEAKKCLQQIVDYYNDNGLAVSSTLYRVHLFLGHIADREQDRQTAINEFEMCLDINDKMDNNNSYTARIQLGRLYNEIGELEKSNLINGALWSETRKLASEVRRTYYADALYNMGVLYYKQEKFFIARNMLRRSLKEYKNANAPSDMICFGKARVYRCLAEWYCTNTYEPADNSIEVAAEHLKVSIDYYKDSVGSEHPEAQSAIKRFEQIKNQI